MTHPAFEALRRAARLAELGVVIRSAELTEQAKNIQDFNARGGNRAMRRAANRAARKRGR